MASLVLLGLTVGPAVADPQSTALPRATASPSPTPLPVIGTTSVVNGSPQSLHRAAQAASVLDRRELRATTAASLDAALRDLPGFDRDRSNAPFTNYGQLRLSFAGAGADRGTLIVDGVPAQDGFGGHVDWNAFPLAAIARADLLRGPGSALYGSGAIGGVLALTTLPAARTTAAAFDVSGGGIDRGSASVEATAAFGSWASSFGIATRRLAFDVIPPGQTSAVDRTAESTADVAHVRFARVTARTNLGFAFSTTADRQQDGRSNDGFARNLDQVAATYVTGVASTVSLTAFARQTRVVNLADRFPSAPGTLLYTQSVPSSDTGVRAQWNRPLPNGALDLIAERRLVSGEALQYNAAGVRQSDVAGTQRLNGFVVQRTWEGRFGATGGARYDDVHTDALGARQAGAISPRVAVRWDASPATAFRAAFGTGLRAPFLNELVRSYSIGKIVYENNPALVPERSRSAQLGLDVVTPSARLAVDVTQTGVADAIGFRTLSPTVQQRANFGRTATQAYTVEYRRGGACADVRAFAVVQHDRVVRGLPSEIGMRLAYVPDSAAALDFERTVGRVTGDIQLSYSGATFADSVQQQPLGSAVLVGARLTLHAANGADVSLGLDNLNDKVYLTSIDRLGPPSSLTLRVAVPVGAHATAPAAPRC